MHYQLLSHHWPSRFGIHLAFRQTRGIKRSASMSGLDDGRGTADTSTSASLARNAPGASSLELYLVPDFFSPSSAPLPLKEDAGAVPLTPTLEAPILIHTIEPVYPAIYATQVESLPVFATAFGNSPRLLRRIDNDYVNLTTLATLSQPPLFAEKLSVLLSSCRNSHTIPFPSSSCSSAGGLSGFWIPLADVQRLCAHGDLNIPACVGEQFLSDILPDLFPEGIAHASRAYKKAGVGMAGLGLHACPTPQPLYQPRAIVDDDVGFDRPPAKRKPGRPRRALTEESMSTLNRSKKIAHVSNGIRRASVPTTPARNATRASLRSSVRSAASAFAA
ncbi:uncharacterized protein EI90DRAFT_3512 [Cantharellus anzutake]|uniref:uncharacterized protein n=1 Tax=Cantharellus anzutake TaxID=1750568 RepID=UPI001902EF50|nr:uncharacterized protein EI90DRAFT_3512 [Cantharellus anzutake]KAF8343778.1 hypothetical protein EI90DRAFT_3512 [Cantharellus anzutake]